MTDASQDARASANSPTDRSSSGDGSESGRARILIVEDDRLVAADLAELLEAMGYAVAANFGTGEEAVDWLEDHDADLVLMDINLQGRMNGIEAAARARELHDIAVVYVTAYADKATLTEARKTEPYGYLVKPFREKELESAIEIARYKHRMELERREFEEQLRQSQKLEGLGRLAGGIAHDFNNLLTGILGNAKLALEELDGSEARLPDLEESLREVVGLGERAARLVGQLLTFSRGRPGVEHKTVPLDDVVERMADLLEPLTGEAIQLDVEIGDSGHVVEGDESQLEQVIMNLVLNARDAMPDGGTISVHLGTAVIDESSDPPSSALAPGRYALLTVSDAGIGMDEETRQRAFDPFFSTRRGSGGTGLGLSIVYGIVRQHGGSVDVDSVPGKGSVFRVYLPSAAEPAPAARDVEPREQEPEGGETILVVDDEPSVLRLVRRMLEHRGYRVLAAADAAQARNLLERNDGVDLILTDVVLPGPSGPEMVRDLPEQWRSIPVLYMSGYTGTDSLPPGMASVATMPEPLIAKPFETSALVERVRQLLDRREEG